MKHIPRRTSKPSAAPGMLRRVKTPKMLDTIVTIRITNAIATAGNKYLPVGSIKVSRLTLTDSKKALKIIFTLSMCLLLLIYIWWEKI